MVTIHVKVKNKQDKLTVIEVKVLLTFEKGREMLRRGYQGFSWDAVYVQYFYLDVNHMLYGLVYFVKTQTGF